MCGGIIENLGIALATPQNRKFYKYKCDFVYFKSRRHSENLFGKFKYWDNRKTVFFSEFVRTSLEFHENYCVICKMKNKIGKMRPRNYS